MKIEIEIYREYDMGVKVLNRVKENAERCLF